MKRKSILLLTLVASILLLTTPAMSNVTYEKENIFNTEQEQDYNDCLPCSLKEKIQENESSPAGGAGFCFLLTVLELRYCRRNYEVGTPDYDECRLDAFFLFFECWLAFP